MGFGGNINPSFLPPPPLPLPLSLCQLKELLAGIHVGPLVLGEFHEALDGGEVLPLHLVVHDVSHLGKEGGEGGREGGTRGMDW